MFKTVIIIISLLGNLLAYFIYKTIIIEKLDEKNGDLEKISDDIILTIMFIISAFFLGVAL